MKKIAFLLIGFLCLACEDDNFIIVNPVEVTNLNHPFEIEAGQTVNLVVSAQAPNDCWSEIEIDLVEIDEFTFEVLAEGKFDTSQPICEEEVVNQTETFSQTFTNPGEYVFKIRKSRTVFEEDIIIVE